MQVRIEPGGLWHRYRDKGRTHTACGKPVPSLTECTRLYVIDELICYDCFTRHERETGEHAALVKEDAKYPDDLPISKRPSSEDRRAMRRREKRDTDVDLQPPDEIVTDPDDD